MCNEEVHELLIQESHINFIFCNKQIQDPGKPKRYFCCKKMKLIKDKLLVCKNCGQVHDYLKGTSLQQKDNFKSQEITVTVKSI